MRNNQPVTHIEYQVPPGSAIISHTDFKGTITFVNEDFIAASGFSRAESVGAPHNIVRHPDIPPGVFRDAWATIAAGRPWQGIVKNRRKNGDYYWIKATMSPLPDGTGYMSVRVRANASDVAAAEALYARRRADPSIRLDQGQLVGAACPDGLRVPSEP